MGEKQRRKQCVVKNTTCFSEHRRYEVDCGKKDCKYWIKHSKSQNCTLVLADEGSQTLQDIGEIFNITRMRICQIEKTILQKFKKKRKYAKLTEF